MDPLSRRATQDRVTSYDTPYAGDPGSRAFAVRRRLPDTPAAAVSAIGRLDARQLVGGRVLGVAGAHQPPQVTLGIAGLEDLAAAPLGPPQTTQLPELPERYEAPFLPRSARSLVAAPCGEGASLPDHDLIRPYGYSLITRPLNGRPHHVAYRDREAQAPRKPFARRSGGRSAVY